MNQWKYLFASILTLPLAAQVNSPLQGRLSFGVTGGAPLNDGSPPASSGVVFVAAALLPVSPLVTSSTGQQRYTVGPNVEFAFTNHISVQFNPLYKLFSSSYSYSSALATIPSTPFISYSARSNTWEFPLIGKYYFRRPEASWRFFAGTGYSFETAWTTQRGFETTIVTPQSTVTVPIDSSYRSPTVTGTVFSEGASWNRGRWALAPELRYTRWSTGSGPRSRNQFDLLLNVRF